MLWGSDDSNLTRLTIKKGVKTCVDFRFGRIISAGSDLPKLKSGFFVVFLNRFTSSVSISGFSSGIPLVYVTFNASRSVEYT
ncbi:hypothetical protein LEP1GSC133_1475 [Leptospira borgpetersenii serovar Pomona str. 200901868]|uniref:Uncharacterized protein n=1 Tax=Leptospira borgpetersenii serovar Pomona str. 200901868 TaxID=1192866 RepID=M6VWE6_LEPBO|nr:hypothetical protein LEP1GSC133_1475 [Leptospira borgpetersenii serovar Pomona str. 200901868]